MPRVGRHPLKEKNLKLDLPAPQRVSVATITHIPVLEGYWAHSLEVLKHFFASLYASTEQPFDLLVFDNASCPEVQAYLLDLRQQGRIQYLTLSTYNLRKLGALDYLLATAPGEYIAFADSDVYFLPGWLEESIKVLETFPEAGAVTALPLAASNVPVHRRSFFEKMQADASVQVETGLFIPDAYITAHRNSLGKSPENYANTHDRMDVRLTRQDVPAYLAGADFQFTARTDLVRQFLPLTKNYTGETFDPIYSPVLETRFAAAGYEGFSTIEYLVHHMGNQLPDLPAELPWVNWAAHPIARPTLAADRKKKPHWFWGRARVRRLLQRLNTAVYRLLYEE